VENILEKYPLHQQPTSALIEKSHALVQLNQAGTAVQTLNQAVTHGNDSKEIHLALAQINGSQTPQETEKIQNILAIPQSGGNSVFVDSRLALRGDQVLSGENKRR